MSVTQEIRRALETRLDAVSGAPAASQRQWDNVSFVPTPGTPWARLVLVPDTRRPAAIGPSPQYRHDGTFLIVVHWPAGVGAGAQDDLCDAICAAYTIDDVLTVGTTNVRFEWSERNDGVTDGDWHIVTVTVRWYTYAAT